jgi:tRNA(Ile)-lysidine synthetase-like protein
MVATRRLSDLTAVVLSAADYPDGRAVVALSGGSDSAVTAWGALKSGMSLRAVHVNHRLGASPRLEAAARSIAAELGLAFDVAGVDGIGLSEAGLRSLRYAALTERLKPEEWLLTGHTADDQAETVLLNLLRGAGLDGLSGIPARRFPLARPLLKVTRSQTREMASLLGLAWIDDPANLGGGPARNRVRLRVLPSLEAEFNPNLRSVLASTAELAASELAALEGRLVPGEFRAGRARVPTGALHAAGPHLGAHSVRAILRRLRPPYPPGNADVDRIMQVVSGRSHRQTISGGITVAQSGPFIEFILPHEPLSPGPVRWAVPGSVDWGAYRFEAVLVGGRPRVMPLSRWQAVMDAGRVGGVLTISTGGRGPIVEGDGGPVWMPGVKTLRAGWVDEATERYLSATCWETRWET